MYQIVCVQGDPRNFALMAHWDGFQSARTRQRDCWTLEISVLNAGMDLHACTFPVMFIPISCVKSMEGSSGTVLRACLTPFIAELEDLFVNGFRTLFPYDFQKIRLSLPVHDIGEPIILRAILMNFTGDHPAQSKAGMLKAGGHLACRRHNIFPHKERILGEGGIPLYEDNQEYVRFPPSRRTAQSLLEAVTYWRSLPQGGERARIARAGGITGYSNLWILYHLHGFNLSTDLVYDTMHILALCVFKKMCPF
jgi:hypothetical protein